MMKTFSPEAEARLRRLVEIKSPSMNETAMTRALIADWQEVTPEGCASVDATGNLIFSIPGEADTPHVALVAHADTVAVQITQILPGGMMKFRAIGVRPHALLGQPVTVITEDGREIDGVVGFDATSQFGQPKGLVEEDLWIDIAADPREAGITVGDLAVMTPRYKRLNEDFLSGTALDDRAGLFVLGEILRSGAWHGLNLHLVATAQEEIGLRGAMALKLPVDAAIILDVDYATDIPTPHEDQTGRLYCGHGPGLHRKADNSAHFHRLIKKTAAEAGIPFQVSVGRFLYGGTDAAPIQISGTDRAPAVANVSIPCRNMHSPVEICAVSDIVQAVSLVEAVMRRLSTIKDFSRWDSIALA